MSKQKQLSPEKYITTKARTLPIYKCYLTRVWEVAGMASVIVMRQHVNGRYTVGIYLVDLLCLGVKDTFYLFNVSRDEMEERLNMDTLQLEEVDYNLVHNIVYAAHDFAMEFDIKPHKNFTITKFILEEDDDTIPLIEIPVGDEDGKPQLLVDAAYNYSPVLKKLEQHAGKGNFTFHLVDEDEEDDEEFDEFDDDDLEDDDEYGDEDDVFMDFNVAKDSSTEELEEQAEIRNYSDGLIINTELLLRQLNDTERGVLEDFETLTQKKDSLGTNEDDLDDESLVKRVLSLLEKYKDNDTVSYMIVNSIPLATVLGSIRMLEANFSQFTPAVQLFVTAHAVLTNQLPDEVYGFIMNADNVEMAYPFNRSIHGMHHKLFWFVKAINALRVNDKENIFYYHNLLRVSGTGGHIRYLYAAQLNTWLNKYMGIDDDDDEYIEDES
jgi:hypothetical protein